MPEHVLDTLASIDDDPSRAIVQLATRRGAAAAKQPNAELFVFGNRAVITVRPTKSLERHTGVDLLPLPDGRALICFEQATTIADLELLLYDAIEHGDLPTDDREVFGAIAKILKDTRRSQDVALCNRSIIMLESGNAQQPKGKATAKRGRRKTRKTPRRHS